MDNFVSRGGIKLEAAIKNWKLPARNATHSVAGGKIKNLVCLDVGSSTGGFVDCLLQNGALKVYSVDTAYGELAWKLRQDKRVVVMERTNILHLQSLPESVDLISIDAGWTKLELVLPAVKKFLKPGGIIVALLKPHYEAERKELDHGIVRPEFLKSVKERVIKKIQDLGFKIQDFMESPILGSKGKGNKEFLLKITV